jgi:hypothetical protein
VQLRQSKIDEFLAQFQVECAKHHLTLEVAASHIRGSHYNLLEEKIVLDRSQIDCFIESTNADPLEVWRVVAFHELGHHLGNYSEEACWDWLEQKSDLDQVVVATVRTQIISGRWATIEGSEWHLIRDCLSAPPIREFIRLNQLPKGTKEAAGVQTPGLCWHFLKKRYIGSFDLESIIKPLLSDSSHLMELCYSQKYDSFDSEIAGLRLWQVIQALL